MRYDHKIDIVLETQLSFLFISCELILEVLLRLVEAWRGFIVLDAVVIKDGVYNMRASNDQLQEEAKRLHEMCASLTVLFRCDYFTLLFVLQLLIALSKF